MLGASPRDTDGIGFLEGVVADQMSWYLTGQTNHRDRVHHGIGKTGYRICRARAGCHEHSAYLTSRARIAFRRVHRRLLVAGQHMPQIVLLEQCVINRKHGAARIAENDVNALVHQGFNDDLASKQFHLSLRYAPQRPQRARKLVSARSAVNRKLSTTAKARTSKSGPGGKVMSGAYWWRNQVSCRLA